VFVCVCVPAYWPTRLCGLDCVCVYICICILLFLLYLLWNSTRVYGQRAYKAAYFCTARVLPHKCGACGAALDLSMPAYWPSRVCGGK
jgi:hypothetical protein